MRERRLLELEVWGSKRYRPELLNRKKGCPLMLIMLGTAPARDSGARAFLPSREGRDYLGHGAISLLPDDVGVTPDSTNGIPPVSVSTIDVGADVTSVAQSTFTWPALLSR